MTAKYFVDTNILLYAYQRADERKRKRADELLRHAIAEEAGVVSAQVLAEFYSVATRLPNPLMTPDEAIEVIELLAHLDVQEIDRFVVRRAAEIAQAFKINYWDGQILAAAERAGVDRVLSEDLNAGQSYAGIRVENPFAELE